MAALTIIIGNRNYSSWSLRPWLALRRTGAPFEEVAIQLRQPDTAATIARYSPSGRLPALRHGAATIWDSLAICEHLADAFPAAKLWPADREARSQARAASAEMHAGFGELRRLLPMDIVRRWPIGDRLAKVAADVERISGIWRDCRQRFGRHGANGPGDFLFGGFSIADAMFAPVVTRFVTYGVPLDEVCSKYVTAVTGWPAMQDWTAAAKAEPWVVNDAVNAAQP